MIFQPAQSRRFYKICNPFLDYMARRFSTASEASFRGRLTDLEVSNTLKALYATEESLQAIDDFVRDNPARLNRTDLRQVQAWKDGVLADFILVVDGRDAMMLFGEYAFAVRGITQELSEIYGDFDFLTTALVPFDGLITYLVVGMKNDVDYDGTFRRDARELLERCKREGKVARSAKDFAKAMPLAKRSNEEGLARLEEQRREMGAHRDDPVPHTHRGVLAGLGPDERSRAMHRYFDEADLGLEKAALEGHYQELLKALAESRRPTESLAELYVGLSRDELRKRLHSYGCKPGAKEGKHALAQELAGRVAANTQFLAALVASEGRNFAGDLHDLLERGGRWDVDENDTEQVLRLVTSTPPIVLLFYHDGTFSNVVPTELREPLAALNWDELRHAGSVEDLCLQSAQGQRLLEYLDERVPDGEDDYLFADSLARDIVFYSRDMPDMQAIFGLLGDYGLVLEPAQANAFAELLIPFVNIVPKWSNNGWSGDEARRIKGRGRIFITRS